MQEYRKTIVDFHAEPWGPKARFPSQSPQYPSLVFAAFKWTSGLYMYLQSPSGKCRTDCNLFLLLGWRIYHIPWKVWNGLKGMWNRLISKPAPLHTGRIRLIKIACFAMHHSYSCSQQFTRISKLTPAMLGTCFPLQRDTSTRRNTKEPSKGEITRTRQPEIKPVTYIIFPFYLVFWNYSSDSFLFGQTSERKQTTCMKTDSINTAHPFRSQTHQLCQCEAGYSQADRQNYRLLSIGSSGERRTKAF